jgi:hypothetical protein
MEPTQFQLRLSKDGDGNFVYLIGGQTNPPLRLVRGSTYTFTLTTGPSHPFAIKTSPVVAAADEYNEGVSGQEAVSGVVTFTVPMTAPSTLYYQCEHFQTMGGVLQITSPGVPVFRPVVATVLTIALLGVGVALWRRRRNSLRWMWRGYTLPWYL